MKTKALFFITLSILALNIKLANANTLCSESNRSAVKADYLSRVETLTISLDSNSESFLEVQPWMVDKRAFESSKSMGMNPIENGSIIENISRESFAQVEEWMFDLPFFMQSNPEEEPILPLEPWMFSVESFDSGYYLPLDESPLEEWMFNF